MTFVSEKSNGNGNGNRDSIPIEVAKPQDAKGVIFDIDGTLADSWKLGFDATQVVLKNNDISPITEDLYHECTKYSTPERLARHAGLLPERDREEFLRKGKSLAAEFDQLYVGLISLETTAFYDGIQALILGLPSCRGIDGDSSSGERNLAGDREGGVKIAALTNACVAYAHAVLKVNCPVFAKTTSSEVINADGDEGVYGRFESIHGADTVPKPKPYPDGLYRCCKDIGISAEKCVYIGDSPSDAVAAKEAGMLAIGVSWGSHSKEVVMSAPFDFVCESVDELRQLLPQ